ncbi:hypothetical protein HAX54_028669 [Datura stramonium]|uniref:Uncharacterized protein n=1 Tax=Datura stramonium TaxID=4076 RepID=A0ABS8V4J3_DATST|nr:hypothetical protein [Datura stramonium]
MESARPGRSRPQGPTQRGIPVVQWSQATQPVPPQQPVRHDHPPPHHTFPSLHGCKPRLERLQVPFKVDIDQVEFGVTSLLAILVGKTSAYNALALEIARLWVSGMPQPGRNHFLINVFDAS